MYLNIYIYVNIAYELGSRSTLHVHVRGGIMAQPDPSSAAILRNMHC